MYLSFRYRAKNKQSTQLALLQAMHSMQGKMQTSLQAHLDMMKAAKNLQLDLHKTLKHVEFRLEGLVEPGHESCRHLVQLMQDRPSKHNSTNNSLVHNNSNTSKHNSKQ